jgi:hypothetical protein
MALTIDEHGMYVDRELPLRILQAMARAVNLGVDATITATIDPGGVKVWFGYSNLDFRIDSILVLNPEDATQCSTQRDVAELMHELECVERYKAAEAQKEATRRLIRAKLTEDELALIEFRS